MYAGYGCSHEKTDKYNTQDASICSPSHTETKVSPLYCGEGGKDKFLPTFIVRGEKGRTHGTTPCKSYKLLSSATICGSFFLFFVIVNISTL